MKISSLYINTKIVRGVAFKDILHFGASAKKMPKRSSKLLFDEKQISMLNTMISKIVNKAIANNKPIELKNSKSIDNINGDVTSKSTSHKVNLDQDCIKNVHKVQSCSSDSSNRKRPVENPLISDKNKYTSHSKRVRENLSQQLEYNEYVNSIMNDFEDCPSESDMDLAETSNNINISSIIGGKFASLPIDASDNDYTNKNHHASSKMGAGNTNKVPPIILQQFDHQLIGDLRKITNQYKGTMLKVLPKSTIIYCKLMEDHKQMVEKLKEADFKFFTYTAKGQRPKLMMVRGIHQDTNIDEIKVDICDKGYKVINVYPMVKKIKNDAGIEKQVKIPSFTVSFDPATRTSEIKQINGCCGYKVSWEIKRKNNITQCHKCQSFGHVASSCNMTFLCVKCAQTHTPGICPADVNTNLEDNLTSTSVPIKCANCGEGHVASYSGCQERLKYIGKLNRTINSKRQNIARTPAQFQSNFITPGLSFADRLKQNNRENSKPVQNSNLLDPSIQPESSTTNNLSEFLSLSEQLFGINFSTLTTQISACLNKIKSINDIAEKKSVYLNFICQFFK